ncbi:hypothetical protein ACI3EY_16690 [Ornithinimicrobium sp. LYQ92]|uniref:hypothetical protein n=1 Tax=Serinicoccus sp. LYQ92 TaxID=3378798 RepID=UPI0038518E85
MSETWLTSDLHLGHEKVAQIRGFDSTRDHDRAVLNGLTRRIGLNDNVFLLGDLAMGPDKDSHLRAIRDAAGHDAHITVVLGNHDRPHPMHNNGHRQLFKWLHLLADAVVTTATIKHAGQVHLMSHFPYDGEGATRPDAVDRDTQWRLRDEGTPLIHGHVHDTVRARTSRLGTPMYHVGLDAWDLAPVTIHELTQETP